MDARTFNTMIIGILTDGKHIDGGSLGGFKHHEHYMYKGDVVVVEYNSDNAPFEIYNSTTRNTFRHPTRSDK